ncbi:MAG TPA: hypothetical protein DCE42_26965 [Myxococcales bacterium]|nr:hypothetical protein [Deltaproteobacteria bacterium]HAA58434.1 hypothetical protein [Myxococcales bacterium]|tara:strand:- start:6308 stop:6781 length:474 start_codon:yes stop_codon:yes gene_type:complete
MSLRLWTWKWIGTLLVGASLMITACAPKLYIKESFRQSVTVPVVEGTIALDRGETIEVAAILKKEKVKPAKVLLTRLMGAYVLTAEGFRNIWFLQPTGKDAASYRFVATPDKKPLTAPQFEHSESHNCVTLVLNNGASKWNIHHSGQIARRCSDVVK